MKIKVLVLSALLVTGLGTVCQADIVTCKIIQANVRYRPDLAEPKIAWSLAKSNTLDGTIFMYGPDAAHLTMWKSFLRPHVYQPGPRPPKLAMPIGDTYTFTWPSGGSSGGGDHYLHGAGGDQIEQAPRTGIALHTVHINANGDVVSVSDFFAHDPFGRISVIFYVAPWSVGGSNLTKDIVNHGAPATPSPSTGPRSTAFGPLVPNVRVLNSTVVAMYDLPCESDN